MIPMNEMRGIEMSWNAYWLLVGSIGLALAGCTSVGEKEPVYTSGTVEENTVTVTAKVAAIDHVDRAVSLLTTDGQSINFQAGPEVKNLDQVDVGDVVRATYYESLVYELMQHGEGAPGVAVADAAGSAEPGEKPAAGVARMVAVTATVVALDRKVPSATFKLPSGEEKTIKVRDPQRLTGVKVGDLVEFTYTQAVAIDVEGIDD